MSKEFVKSVLAEDADEHVPTGANVWPAMHSQLQQAAPTVREPRRLRLNSLALAGALALLLLGLGLLASATLTGLTVTQPAPVSAAELLTRVEQATNKGSKSALTSFHGVTVAEQRNRSTEEFSHLREEQWYLAPDSLRMDAHITSKQGEESVLLWVTNGKTGWKYDSYFGKADPLTAKELNGSFGASGVKEMLGGKMVKSFYNVEVKGTTQVGGRGAYVVELTLKPDKEWPQNMWPSEMARSVLSVDSEFFFILYSQAWDAAGNLLSTQQWESYELNPSVDPAIFNVAPPTPKK
jgi:hypothetical protein